MTTKAFLASEHRYPNSIDLNLASQHAVNVQARSIVLSRICTPTFDAYLHTDLLYWQLTADLNASQLVDPNV